MLAANLNDFNFSSRPVNKEMLLMQIQALALPTALLLHTMQMSLLILNRYNRTKKRGRTTKQGLQNWGKYFFSRMKKVELLLEVWRILMKNICLDMLQTSTALKKCSKSWKLSWPSTNFTRAEHFGCNECFVKYTEWKLACAQTTCMTNHVMWCSTVLKTPYWLL